MRRRWLVIPAVAAIALVMGGSGGARGVQQGGTFRVAVPVGFVEAIDPAIYNLASSAQLLRPACASLFNFPNKPVPAGLRLAPELAQGEPVVSRNGKTYTFTIRKDARFSNGAPVLARDVVHSLERVLTPTMQSPAGPALANVVGAQAILDGKATRLVGAVAKDRRVTLRLTKPLADFPARVSVCLVPANLPIAPEGAKAPLPSPAPYFVAEYVPNERLVLERNRFYRGERPHHVDRIVADLSSDVGAVLEQVKSGSVEYGWIPGTAWGPFLNELTQRYGVNKTQFFAVPGTFLRMFVLNTSRPLFRNNVKLRQAVNFAVDRKALIREFGVAAGTMTDQYMPPIFPGYRNETIYPLKGPDVREARSLAAGRTRGGKAILYTCTQPVCVAQAQIVQRNLEPIGIEVEIMQFPGPLLFQKLGTLGEPFDIGWIGWGMCCPESFGELFDGRTIGQAGSSNWSYFNSATYNRLIDAAARLRLGPARYRAYGDLDIRLSRDAAPGIPYGVTNALTFVSANAGCIVLNPFLDLTAVCLK
jgi:peptide/nickel transport system substrate-binding protein